MPNVTVRRHPCLVGQKAPLRLRDIWAIRVRLQISDKTRDLALFDLAIDSKLRACDLTRLRVRDVAHGKHVASRAIVMQKKTQTPVHWGGAGQLSQFTSCPRRARFNKPGNIGAPAARRSGGTPNQPLRFYSAFVSNEEFRLVCERQTTWRIARLLFCAIHCKAEQSGRLHLIHVPHEGRGARSGR